MSTREKLLAKASIIIGKNGDRNRQYGHPLTDFSRTAELWNALLGSSIRDAAAEGRAYRFTPKDVAKMMICLKLSRLEADGTHADSWLDIAGYAACGAEVAGIEPDAYEEATKEAPNGVQVAKP